MRERLHTLIKQNKGIYLAISKKGEPYLSFVNPDVIKSLTADELSYVQPRLMAMQADVMMNISIKTVVERTLPFVKECNTEMLVNALKREIAKHSYIEDVNKYLDVLIENHFKDPVFYC